MIAVMNNKIIKYLELINPSRLFGPVFMKELIISSRRKRNFLIRFLYPVILAVFVFYVFVTVSDFTNQTLSVVQVSKMAQIGIGITTIIVLFQFFIVQLLAMIMLSTSISDEIYNKTLGVLMTTPIKSIHIVFGKLLSKLYQLLLIVGISFPVLAIIRVFGGVSWNYVFSSICITLTSAIFAGSLSLFFSIYHRTSQLVLSKVIGVCFLIYTVPWIAFSILKELGRYDIAMYIPKLGLFLINPFILMERMTRNMMSPGVSVVIEPWLVHCVIMLVLSLAVLFFSASCVRKAGLRQITGQGGLLLTRKERKIADKKIKMYRRSEALGQIRDINWPPVIWREISNPLIKTGRISTVINIVLLVIALIIIYSLCIYKNVLTMPQTQIAFILIYFLIGLIRTSANASTSITSEKEARSWPILLMTPMDAKEISMQKIIGSLMRAWPVWLLLVVHLFIFILFRVVSILVLIPLVPLVISSAFLFSSIGVLFSSVCKRSSTSSTLNTLTLFFVTVPVCCSPLFVFSPLFAALAILCNWGGFDNITDFSFPTISEDGFWGVLFSPYFFIIYIIIYLLLSFFAKIISDENIRSRIL